MVAFVSPLGGPSVVSGQPLALTLLGAEVMFVSPYPLGVIEVSTDLVDRAAPVTGQGVFF